MRRELGFAGAEGDEGGIVVAGGKQVAGIEVEAHRRIVGWHQGHWAFLGGGEEAVLAGDGQYFFVAINGKVAPDLVAVDQGIAHKVLVADDVNPLRRPRAAFEVVAVVIGPQRIGLRVEVHADDVADARGKDAAVAAVGIELQDGAALGMMGHGLGGVADDLKALVHAAQVAGRADRQIHFVVAAIDDEGASIVPTLPRNVGQNDFFLFVY